MAYQSISSVEPRLVSRPNDYGLNFTSLTPETTAIDTPSYTSLSNAFEPVRGNYSTWDQFTNWAKTSGLLGTVDKNGMKTEGLGGLALGGANALMSGFMGMQQYKLAKDSLAQSKKQFDLNYAAQKTSMNTQLEDRQRARVASNATGYQSVSDYMNQNGIK